MSARETIFATLRRSLAGDEETARQLAVDARLAEAPRGLVPQRGQLDPEGRVALFARKLEAVNATVERIGTADEVPARVADYLRRHNLAQTAVCGRDPRLAALPWESQPQIELTTGPANGDEQTGLSHALAGVAETGTLALASGPDNPTTINFLPEHHIVAVAAEDIVGDYESVWAHLRGTYGKGRMPRLVNLITGPSRSADIEQTLLLGAHGPRRVHVVIVG